MKVLIADKFEAFGIAELKKIADEVTCEPELKDEALTKRVLKFADERQLELPPAG